MSRLEKAFEKPDHEQQYIELKNYLLNFKFPEAPKPVEVDKEDNIIIEDKILDMSSPDKVWPDPVWLMKLFPNKDPDFGLVEKDSVYKLSGLTTEHQITFDTNLNSQPVMLVSISGKCLIIDITEDCNFLYFLRSTDYEPTEKSIQDFLRMIFMLYTNAQLLSYNGTSPKYNKYIVPELNRRQQSNDELIKMKRLIDEYLEPTNNSSDKITVKEVQDMYMSEYNKEILDKQVITLCKELGLQYFKDHRKHYEKGVFEGYKIKDSKLPASPAPILTATDIKVNNMKKLIQERLEITGKRTDKMTKSEINVKYQEMFNTMLSQDEIIDVCKKAGLEYSSNNSKNCVRGVIMGVKDKGE